MTLKSLIQQIKNRGVRVQLYTLSAGGWFVLPNGRVLHIKTSAHNHQHLSGNHCYGVTMMGSFCKFTPNRYVAIPTDEEVLEYLRLVQMEVRPLETNCGACNKNCAHRTEPCALDVTPAATCCCPHCGGGA